MSRKPSLGRLGSLLGKSGPSWDIFRPRLSKIPVYPANTKKHIFVLVFRSLGKLPRDTQGAPGGHLVV